MKKMPGEKMCVANGANAGQLSETAVSSALASLSWEALKTHLENVGNLEGEVDRLVGIIRRNNAIVFKRGEVKKRKMRAKMLGSLQLFLREKGLEAAAEIDTICSLLSIIEAGYDGILAASSECDAAAIPAAKKVSAIVYRSAHEHGHMLRDYESSLKDKQEFMCGAPMRMASGQIVDPGAIHTSLIRATTSAILMEAHKEGWFDDKGLVVIPPLCDVTKHERYVVGTVHALAASWHNWENAEQRARFRDGTLTQCASKPVWASEVLTEWFEFHPNLKTELLDYVANHRLEERLNQNHLQLLGRDPDVEGIEGLAALPPDAVVSAQELSGGVALSTVLAFDIVRHEERVSGLRLVEWLRGYAVLQALAQRYDKQDDPASMCLVLPEAELQARLMRLGLDEESAKTFIHAACLTRSSRDMFDQPLVKISDGTLLLFCPAASHSILSQVILSVLANRGASVGAKGKALERYVLEFLTELGFNAVSFVARRDKEEYEYDAVFAWGEYLFVIECKNRSLSANNPIRAFYFGLETSSHVAQVR